MKKIKYLIFILPFFLGFNVFAQELDVTSNCYGTTGYANMYSGAEVQYQTYSNYNFGTTYQYQLSSFETELRYNLSANTDYVITFNTNNSNDFRNNFRTYNVYDMNNNDNNLVTGFTFVSMKKVQISFKTTTATNKVKIQMGGSNVYDNITGETNWNIKNVILTIPDTAPSGSTNQDIINNQTNNTNSIINNNNQNTSDIINNNNQNTQSILDSQKVCKFIDMAYANTNGYLNSNGDVVPDSSNQWGITDYINIQSSTIKVETQMTSGAYTCFYNVNKSKISCTSQSNLTSGSSVFIPDSSVYVRFSIYKTLNIPTFNICTNGNQDISNGINDLNSSINNSNIDSDVGSGFFDNFNNNMHGLSSIITIPLTSIQSLTNSTCTPLHFPIPFTDNKYLDVPCMTTIYEQYVPTLLILIQTCWYGILAYKVLVNIFGIVKGFKDPDSDKIEVMDL